MSYLRWAVVFTALAVVFTVLTIADYRRFGCYTGQQATGLVIGGVGIGLALGFAVALQQIDGARRRLR